MSRHLTWAELEAEATAAFGPGQYKWQFRCPNCGDVADATDFIAAGTEGDRAGRECIGRSLGANAPGVAKDRGRVAGVRGCDWTAYGLLPGPWFVTMPADQRVRSPHGAAVDAADYVLPIFPLAAAGVS